MVLQLPVFCVQWDMKPCGGQNKTALHSQVTEIIPVESKHKNHLGSPSQPFLPAVVDRNKDLAGLIKNNNGNVKYSAKMFQNPCRKDNHHESLIDRQLQYCYKVFRCGIFIAKYLKIFSIGNVVVREQKS